MVACTPTEETIDIEKEEEAIKTVIREEIALYLDRDYIRESETWKNENYVRMIRHFGNDHDQIVGWDNILTELKKESEEDWSEYSDMTSESRDFNIRIFGEVAWAVFYQDWEYKMSDQTGGGTQSRIYILEKVDDKWKISLMTMANLDPCEMDDEEIEVKTEVTESY
jgi:hypothetical protein